MKGLSPTSRKAVIATLAISMVLALSSMTAPLMGHIMQSYPPPEYDPFMIMQVTATVAFIVTAAVGLLALRVSLKYLMGAAAVAALAYSLAFALMGTSGNFTLLLVAAGIAGIPQGAAMVLALSILGAYVHDPGLRTSLVAVTIALMGCGAMAVAAVGSAVAAQGDGVAWNAAYWLGLLIIPCLVVFWLMLPKSPDAAEAGSPGGLTAPPQATGGIPAKAFLLIALGLVAALGMTGLTLNIGAYVIEELGAGAGLGYTAAEAGSASSLLGVLGIVAGFSFPLAARLLKNWIAAAGFLVAALGLLMALVLPSPVAFIYIGAGLCGFGYGIATPMVIGRIMAITPPRTVPIALSLYVLATNLVITVSPVVMHALGSLHGPTSSSQILVGIVVTSAAAVLAVVLLVFMRDPAQKAPSAE